MHSFAASQCYLQRVSDSEDKLESDEITVDCDYSEDPRDAQHWQNYENVADQRPANTNTASWSIRKEL